MILSLMFHRILTTMFVNHYVCSFEKKFVKILNIRLFISTIVILAFSIIVVILIVLTEVYTGSFGRTLFLMNMIPV